MKVAVCCLLGFVAMASSAVMRNITISNQYSELGINTLSFFCLGDWGKSSTYSSRKLNGGGHDDDLSDITIAAKASGNNQQQNDQYYQKQIAASMDKYASNSVVKPKWLESLGDNFYKNGVSSTSDSMWTYLYANVYLIYSSLRIPFYPVTYNLFILTPIS